MQLKSFFTAVSFAIVSVVQGAAIAPRATQDVWNPQILTPNASTIWTFGTCQNVTWDTSGAPVNISNRASVQLFSADRTYHPVLAQGFSLRDGSVEVKVPQGTPGDFTITLFGDSGNWSPLFKIVQQE